MLVVSLKQYDRLAIGIRSPVRDVLLLSCNSLQSEQKLEDSWPKRHRSIKSIGHSRHSHSQQTYKNRKARKPARKRLGFIWFHVMCRDLQSCSCRKNHQDKYQRFHSRLNDVAKGRQAFVDLNGFKSAIFLFDLDQHDISGQDTA